MCNLPILYSFRRCPYAMRARMALYASHIDIELREIFLANKPPEMLLVSPKATVPVLITCSNEVIDESLDIMKWALAIEDSQGWLSNYSSEIIHRMGVLIDENDTTFKQHLDHYKYAERFPDGSAESYRLHGEVFLAKLEKQLAHTNYLFSDQPSLADIAIFPFIRQFAGVDTIWFKQSGYLKLQLWLQRLVDSEQFLKVMEKFPVWEAGDNPLIFSANPAKMLNTSFKQ